MQQKIAAITGINGFIGKNIHEHLINKGYMVVGVPRQILGDPLALAHFMNNLNPNLIYHCAAYGNHSNQREFDEIIIANLVNTYSLLRATVNINYDAFFNLSSSSVYGKKTYVMREKDFLEPDNFYASTKASAEFLARPFAKTLGKNIVNIRPFSVYGPYEKNHRLIPTIINTLLKNETMELIEPPVHDWIYVKDFIGALEVIEKNIDKLKGYSINVGTGRQYTNREVYDAISDMMDLKTKVRPTKTPRDYESPYWRADITTLRLFSWRPKYTLEEGLIETIKYYKDEFYKKNNVETTVSLSSVMDITLKQFGVKFESL